MPAHRAGTDWYIPDGATASDEVPPRATPEALPEALRAPAPITGLRNTTCKCLFLLVLTSIFLGGYRWA